MPFMIENAEGLRSSGGQRPRFVDAKKGKVWRTIGQVKAHLAQFRGRNQNNVPSDWVVVELELTPTGKQFNALEITLPHAAAANERHHHNEARDAEARIARDIAELQRLSAKYGKAVDR